MSEQSRNLALEMAVRISKDEDSTCNILTAANSFYAFLQGTPDPQPSPSIEVKPAKAKPGRPAKQPAKSEEELVKEAAVVEAEPESDAPTKEAIGLAVESMLKANKRKEAVALLKQFGAESVSGLAQDKYADFLDEAQTVLMSA